MFVVGVGNNGKPDGGISLNVGRQSRKDWIDSVISSNVAPYGNYVVHFIKNGGAGLEIKPDKAIVLIGFAASEYGPHMAWDNRYYIRTGAHTNPASHFIVEAIRARRGLRSPLIRHVVRRKQDVDHVIQIGIVCLNDEPALNVVIQINPLPRCFKIYKINLPFVVPVISKEISFFFDLDYGSLGETEDEIFEMQVEYLDIKRTGYQIICTVDISTQMGPSFSGNRRLGDNLGKIADKIDDLARSIRSK